MTEIVSQNLRALWGKFVVKLERELSGNEGADQKNAVFEKVINYLVGADKNYKNCGDV